MRNCFTKIANIFRKSPLQNQLIHENLNEECLQLDHCEGDAKEGKLKVTRAHLTIVNGPDGSTSTSDKLAHGDNSENDKTTNTMSHRKISNEKVDNKLCAIQTSIQTTPSLPNEKDKQHCFRTKSQHKKIRSKNIRTQSNFDHSQALVGKENDNEIDVSENLETLLLQKSIEHQETIAILEELETHLRNTNAANVTNRCAKDLEIDMKASSNVAAEDVDDEARMAAEGTDLVTPLPRTNPLKHYGYVRSIQPDIIDAIRNLDAHALRINNISLEDKFELLRRYEYKQKFPRLPCHISIKSNLSSADEKQEKNHSEQLNMDLQKNTYDDVVLRGKPVLHRNRSLYERRQPRQPKLKLIIKKAEDQDPCLSKTTMEAEYLLPTVVPPKLPLKGLLVFGKEDKILQLVQQACNRREVDISIARTLEATTEKLTTGPDIYHLIVLDGRYPNFLDAVEIAKTIRLTEGYNCATIVALVKRSFFESDATMTAFLDAGINVQETISKHLSEYFISDLTQWTNALKPKDLTGDKPLDFAGTVLVKGKTLESTSFPVRARQIACYGRITTHLIFNVDIPVTSQADSSVVLSHTRDFRGNLAAVRRSSDFKGMQTESRRASAAKLAAMPLEAPITKIINLLSQLQENCSLDEAHLIDRVLDFLKYESLYSPQMKDIQMEDPIATELIGALITGSNVHSSRRSSNDSTIRTAITRPTASLISTMKAAPLIMDALKESLSWDFDIFRFEKITEKRPLLYLGMEIFDKFNVFTSMRMDQTVFKNWFVAVESRYHAQNAYHNSTHAADVLQAIGVFLSHFSKKEISMDCLEEASALIAAVVHDIDHPGRSSAYLCNSNNPLAILYNDVTVLENHHAAYFFKLTLCNKNYKIINYSRVWRNSMSFLWIAGDDSVNIFKNLEPDIYKSMRNIIIDMILATEMTRHFEHLAKFVSVFGGEMNCNKELVTIEEDSALLMRRMLIKVADVSNPSRPYLFCVEWAQRIAEEYFQQTEEEKSQNMPIVMPMFDRCTCSIPKSQIGFIEYIVMDMLLAWDNFIDMPELITYVRNNLEMWKHLEEEGVRTISDVKRRQAALTIRKTSVK
uniref:PDEase domain-containing protein n=1 Tax=Glossina austeni TaxID=7395 RepID=A0A1A9VLC2_GLOAU